MGLGLWDNAMCLVVALVSYQVTFEWHSGRGWETSVV